MRDLGEGRLETLAVRVHADAQFEAAIGGEPDGQARAGHREQPV